MTATSSPLCLPAGNPVTLLDLLRHAYVLMCQRCGTSDALDHALLAAIESAVGLAEVRDGGCADDAERQRCLVEAYACSRASATAVRFAVIETGDRLRAGAAQ